jgi:hypothetical protein
MGMFDRVYTKCPKCGERVECQSKSGPCDLDEYESLELAPANVVAGILGGGGWTECDKCKAWLIIEPTGFKVTWKADGDKTDG